MDKLLGNKLKEIQQQYNDYLNEMSASGRIEDRAFAMYLLLKDLVSGAYSPETIKECAESLIKQIEGK